MTPSHGGGPPFRVRLAVCCCLGLVAPRATALVVTGRAAEGRSVADPALVAGAEKLLPGLEANVRKVLAHLRQAPRLGEGDAEQAEEQHVINGLVQALASSDELLHSSGAAAAVKRVLTLHSALAAAQSLFAGKVHKLESQRTQLAQDIDSQQVYLLYRMLRQRRSLPMQAQAALLRRPMFLNCTQAMLLLKSHRDGVPLYTQLEGLLPRALAQQLLGDGSPTPDRLAAAGSEGRVHIVTSKLKNMVRSMEQQLVSSRERLEQAMHAPSATPIPRQKAQLQQILTGIDDTLRQVHGTDDLKKELDLMYDVQGKLKLWMANMAKEGQQ